MCSDLLYCEIPGELYLYNVTNDNHMYILFNTHLTIWYNLKILPSKLNYYPLRNLARMSNPCAQHAEHKQEDDD